VCGLHNTHQLEPDQAIGRPDTNPNKYLLSRESNSDI